MAPVPGMPRLRHSVLLRMVGLRLTLCCRFDDNLGSTLLGLSLELRGPCIDLKTRRKSLQIVNLGLCGPIDC